MRFLILIGFVTFLVLLSCDPDENKDDEEENFLEHNENGENKDDEEDIFLQQVDDNAETPNHKEDENSAETWYS